MIRSIEALTASSYLCMLFLGLSSTIVGAAAKNIGLSPEQIGLMVALQNVGFVLSVSLTGAIADTYEKPRLLLWGSVVLVAGLLIFYLGGVFWVYLVAMILTGVGTGAYEGVADAMILDLHQTRESLHITINHMFVSIGSVAITVSMIFLPGQDMWRTAVILSAVVASLLTGFFVVARLEPQGKHSESFQARMKMLAGNKLIALLFGCVILAVGVELGTVGVLTSFLVDLRGFSDVASKLGLFAFLAGMISGRFLVGLLSQNQHVPRYIIGLFGTACLVFSLLFLINIGTLATYALIYLAGISLSATLPLIITLAGLKFKHMAGTVMGAIKVAIPLGGIIIPAIMSAITGATSFQVSLLLFPLSFLIGFVLLYSQRRQLLM